MGSFSAPDGTTFETKREWRDYMFAKYYSFTNVDGSGDGSEESKVLTKWPGDVGGQEFHIKNVKSCEVRVLDHIDRLIAEDLEGCRVFVGACEESAVLRRCRDCEVTIACKQIRLTDCVGCTFRAFVKSDSNLEDSHGITFAPFNGHYEGIEAHMEAAKLLGFENKWGNIMDFSKANAELPTPHFTKSSDAGEQWTVEVSSAATAEAEPPAAPAPFVEDPVLVDEEGDNEFDPFGDDQMLGNGEEEVDHNRQSSTEFDAFAGADNDMDPFAAPPTASSDVNEPEAEVDPADPFLETSEEDPFAAAVAEEEEAEQGEEEEPDFRIEWGKKHREEMREKDAANDAARAAIREKAEEELEDFYAQRTNNIAIRSANNRKDEQEFLASLAAAKANAENPWARVTSLIDLKADVDKTDLSRMRNVLLQLKAAAFNPGS